MSSSNGPLFKARGFFPLLHKNCWIAPTAAIIGNVQIDDGASVWFHSVLRGDVMPIRVGRETNIQDNTVIHGTFEKCGTTLEERVTIGHSCVLHGTYVEKNCLIGMGSLLMDHSRVGSGSIVGAGSLVTEGSVFPSGVLILGRPAKVIRPLRSEEIAFLSQSAANYLLYQTWYEKFDQKGGS
jgi:carbonic anhydrase/acetyltransferase-like protein (isoleucine patch superfamily)